MPVKVTAVTPPRPSTAARRREARGRAQAHRQAAALYDAIKRNSVAAATEALDGGATPHQVRAGELWRRVVVRRLVDDSCDT